MQLAGVALHTRGGLEDVLDAFDAVDLDLVSGLEGVAFHVLEVDESLLALVDFKFATLHVFFDVGDLRFEFAFFDCAHVEFLLESVNHGLLLADDLRLGVALLELLRVESVDHGLELVVVLGEGSFAVFFFLLGLLQLFVGFVEFLG